MQFIVLSIIYIALIVSGLIFQKKRSLFFVMLFFCTFLLAFRSNDADYLIYIRRFFNSTGSEEFTEVLFSAYINLLRALSFDFRGFLLLSAIICVWVPGLLVWKHSQNPCKVFALYMLYSYPVDGIQVRNTLAACFILYGIFALSDHKRFAVLRYVICVALATLIHASSILFALLLLAYVIRDRKKLFLFTGAIVVVEFVVLIGLLLLNGFEGLYKIKVLEYLFSHLHNDQWQIFVFSVKSIILFCIAYGLMEIEKMLLVEDRLPLLGRSLCDQIEFAQAIQIVSLLYVPMYLVTFDLYRLQRYTILTFLCAISTIGKGKDKKKYYLLLALQLLGFAVIVYLFLIHSGDHTRTILSLLKDPLKFVGEGSR